MLGVAGACLQEQLHWVEEVVAPELRSRLGQSDIHSQACQDNGEDGYGPTEADFLRCFILHFKPKRIFQIGCGVSTAISLRAVAEVPYTPRIICVEPYPTAFMRRSFKDGAIELVQQRLQDVDPVLVAELQDGDLFFVDSSHTLGPAGEVTRIVLEFLPRLSEGVFAHFHDIYFPHDYAGDVLENALFFAHESALLLAFLTLNPHYRLLASFAMLHHEKREALMRLFPRYVPAPYVDGLRAGAGHFPSSLFIRRAAN